MSRPDEDDALTLLPALVRRVLYAIEHDDDHRVNRRGHAGAARELAQWALVTPTRGVLAPSEDADYRAIEAIARRWLRYADANKAVRKALSDLKERPRDQDELTSALKWQQSIGETAYYYAGLTCGLTLAAIAERG
jgi:hypothetical protein